MNLRTLLHAERSINMKRAELVKYIMKLSVPDPDELDAWAMGIFEEDPEDGDCLTRQFVVFGKLKDCAEAVAGCLTRKQKPPTASMRILSFQGEVPEIECRSNDFCF